MDIFNLKQLPVQAQSNPSPCISIKGWLSLPAARLILYDSLGKMAAYMLLFVVTAAALCLTVNSLCRFHSLLAQAMRRARTKRRKVDNYFTRDFKANYSLLSGGLAHALVHPCTVANRAPRCQLWQRVMVRLRWTETTLE